MVGAGEHLDPVCDVVALEPVTQWRKRVGRRHVVVLAEPEVERSDDAVGPEVWRVGFVGDQPRGVQQRRGGHVVAERLSGAQAEPSAHAEAHATPRPVRVDRGDDQRGVLEDRLVVQARHELAHAPKLLLVAGRQALDPRPPVERDVEEQIRQRRGVTGIGQPPGMVVQHVADPERVHVHDHERGRAAALRAGHVDGHDAASGLDLKPL